MKNKVYKGILRVIILIATVFLTNLSSFAQTDSADVEEVSVSTYEPTLEIKTLKKSDYSRDISVILIGEGEESLPIKDATITFYNVLGDKKVELGKASTDLKGKAILNVKSDYAFLKDAENKINLLATFDGSDALSPIESAIAVKDLKLTMELTEVDSVKTIHVTAHIIDAKGELIPLNEIEFNFFIQGLYSRLKIGEGFLEAGECDFEFPVDLKGDHLGNLDIYAAFIENEEFGDVEVMKTAKWGTHRANYQEEERTLWTTGAPKWMIITLTIMLLGVWSHYMYAVIQLFLIKKEGNQIEKQKS